MLHKKNPNQPNKQKKPQYIIYELKNGNNINLVSLQGVFSNQITFQFCQKLKDLQIFFYERSPGSSNLELLNCSF